MSRWLPHPEHVLSEVEGRFSQGGIFGNNGLLLTLAAIL